MGALIVVIVGGCAAGVVYLSTRPAPVSYDSAGRIRTDGRLQPARLPSAALPGVSFQALVTALHEISGVHTTYSPDLVWDGGFAERLDPAVGVSLTVSAVPARTEDGAYSASCLYRTAKSPISVDAVKVQLVRECALAALRPPVASVAIAWLETSRDRSQTTRFGNVWVTADRSPSVYGVVISAN